MINQGDARDVGGIDQLRDDRTFNHIDRSNARPPLPPKQFRVQKAQNGIRFFAADRSRIAPEDGRLSSSVRYRVRWAEQLDPSDTDKIEAAFVRSTIIAAIEGTGKEGVEASVYVVDPMYSSGYYFCTGVDGNGEEGTEYSTPVQVTNQILDDSIPGDVTHAQVSESGSAHNDVVYSEISVSCRAPNPLTSFAGVQLFLDHYHELNAAPQEGYTQNYSGPAGGPINFKVTYPVCRRKGLATISATNGSTAVTGSGFLNVVRTGDLIEILGTRGTIQSVNTDTSITLTANWTGKTVAAFTDYNFIGRVDVYLVSISKGGTHRFDWRNSPGASVLFDGDLSAPNAPSIAATAQGNDVRIDLTPVTGTKIDRYIIYRGTGTGLAFSACTPIKTIPADTNNNTGILQWVDTKFSVYEREQNQTFSYYATAVNVGDQESAASSRAEASCRLDSPGDGGGTNPARFVAKNMMWDAMLSGTAGDINAAVAATVDADMGVALPAGFYRPVGSVFGVGSAPAYQNGREILLAMTGAAAFGQSVVTFKLDASDNATAANRRVPKGKMVSIQWQARHSAGVINGFVKADVVQVNNTASGVITGATNASPIVITTSAAHGFSTGQKRVWISGVTGNTAANGVWTITVLSGTTFSLDTSNGNGAYVAGGAVWGFAGLKQRASNDVVNYDGFQLVVDGSNITDVHSLYWGAFYLDPAFITEQIQARIYYETTNWSGVNIAIMEPMLALGDGIPYWSAEIDPFTTYPPVGGGVAPPRGRFTDLDGGRREFVRLP